MLTKNKLLFLSMSLSAMLLIGSFVFALESKDIAYPIAELGSCADKKACKEFCDNSNNMTTCVNFAEKYNLISKTEVKKAKIIAKLEEKAGPGGCKSNQECRTYCEDMNHLQECLDFAQENDIMDKEELSEARKISSALKKGAKMPGSCTNKKSCEEYCDDESHMEECISFAESAGLMKPEEIEIIKKTGGKGPGGCRGKKQCDDYCGNPDNMESCMNFAIENNLMPEQEKKEAEKMLKAIKSGVKPPKCRGRQECDAYCQTPEHSKECLDFAVASGFIKKEEAEQARKMMEAGVVGGPGGCKGKEECENFCQKPENMEECMSFAVKSGMMSQEEYERAKEFKDQKFQGGPGGCKNKEECDQYCSEHQEECEAFFKQNFKPEDDRREFRPEMPRGGEEMMTGPGGCKGKEECDKYCSEHQEECEAFFKQNFKPEDNRNIPEMTGPGGCRGKEECDKYCSDHQEECEKFFNQQDFRSEDDRLEMRDKKPPIIMEERKEMIGPGGCKNKEECDRYCSEHQEECGKFFNQQNPKPQDNSLEMRDKKPPIITEERKEMIGPGGCKSKEECDKYCSEHPDECGHPEGFDESMKKQRIPAPGEFEPEREDGFNQNQPPQGFDNNIMNQNPDGNLPRPDFQGGFEPGQNMPPQGSFNQPSEPAPFSGDGPNALVCDMFKMAPSCDMVPSDAREMCIKCKNQ